VISFWKRSVSLMQVPPSRRLMIRAERRVLHHLGLRAMMSSQTRTLSTWHGLLMISQLAFTPLIPRVLETEAQDLFQEGFHQGAVLR